MSTSSIVFYMLETMKQFPKGSNDFTEVHERNPFSLSIVTHRSSKVVWKTKQNWRQNWDVNPGAAENAQE